MPFGDFINPAPFSDVKSATFMLHPVGKCVTVFGLTKVEKYASDLVFCLSTTHLAADDDERSLRNHDRHWIEVIAVHEFFPGHYYQSLLAQDHPRPLRKWYISPRFYEGWGLYCEQLAYEAQFYTEVRHMHMADAIDIIDWD